jgi:uncharacterized membrane protein YbhN (UPF0104 family)
MTLITRIIGNRLIRWGFAAAAIAIGVYAVAADWHRIGPALGRIGLPMSLAALAVTLLALAAGMCQWRVLLAGLGSPLPVLVAARVLFIGQLGKYLPGSVWPVLAQMELAADHRVPRHRTASASLINMLVTLLAALITAMITLPLTGGSTPYLWAFAAIPFAVACVHPKVLNYLLGLMFRLARRPPPEQPLTGRVIASALGWAFISFVCYGAAVWLLAIRVGVPAGIAVPLSIGGFAFAWSLGFIVILAPAGAGIREVVMVAILSHPIGVTAAAALAVALVSRAVTAAADLITAALAAVSHRRGKRENLTDATAEREKRDGDKPRLTVPDS